MAPNIRRSKAPIKDPKLARGLLELRQYKPQRLRIDQMMATYSVFWLRPVGSASVAGLVRGAALGLGLLIVAAGSVSAVYIAKSALGINVFPGHAPLLHAALYTLVWG